MKEYIKMIVFIVILGVISAGVLIGVDALTKDRIETNKLREFQETILNANGTEFNGNNISDIYAKFITTEDEEGLTIYNHSGTGNVSFTYRGSGLWGDIYGLITLEEDFVTIVNIAVLEQEETPGLGAIVGEKHFLDRFVGKKFDPEIKIIAGADPDKTDEIDRITGATGTSTAFQKILNDTYKLHYQVFRGGGILTEDEIILKELLVSYKYDFTKDKRNINIIANELFTIHKKDDLTIYENITSGNLSVHFVSDKGVNSGGAPGQGDPIKGILTLKNDFLTIENIYVYSSSEVWGKSLLEEESLSKLKGAKIIDKLFTVKGKDGQEDYNGIIDGTTGVTNTPRIMNKALNDVYEANKDFAASLELTYSNDFRIDILNQYEIEFKEDLSDLLDVFAANFTVYKNETDFIVTKNGLDNTYMYHSNLRFGFGGTVVEDILTIISLSTDNLTVVKIETIYSLEFEKQWGKSKFLQQEVLDRAIGKNISEVSFSNSGKTEIDGSVDGSTGSSIPYTIEDFNKALSANYTLYSSTLKGGN